MIRSQGFQVAWDAGYGRNRSTVKDALDLSQGLKNLPDSLYNLLQLP